MVCSLAGRHGKQLGFIWLIIFRQRLGRGRLAGLSLQDPTPSSMFFNLSSPYSSNANPARMLLSSSGTTGEPRAPLFHFFPAAGSIRKAERQIFEDHSRCP